MVNASGLGIPGRAQISPTATRADPAPMRLASPPSVCSGMRSQHATHQCLWRRTRSAAGERMTTAGKEFNMYASQFNYDMAEEPTDPRHELEERIGNLLDEGDAEITRDFAEFAYDRIGHHEIVEAMAALFRGTDTRHRHIRQRASEDVVSEPLAGLQISMEAYRDSFIAERATKLLESN